MRPFVPRLFEESLDRQELLSLRIVQEKATNWLSDKTTRRKLGVRHDIALTVNLEPPEVLRSSNGVG